MNVNELIAELKSGDVESLERRIGEDPSLASARDSNGVSFLMLTIYHGKEDLARVIARAREIDLFEAAALGDSARVSELLDRNAELVDARSPDGFTPLGFAAFFGRPEVVELLLAHGAAVDLAADNPMRVRPLHSAVANRDDAIALRIAGRLLDGGADPNARQQQGWTPLHSVAMHGRGDLVELLLAHGAKPDVANDDGELSAELAEREGHAEIAGRLRS